MHQSSAPAWASAWRMRREEEKLVEKELKCYYCLYATYYWWRGDFCTLKPEEREIDIEQLACKDLILRGAREPSSEDT